jgi:serine protease Do
MRSLSAPAVAMPSFADVIDRVKPAVVSVRVKVQTWRPAMAGATSSSPAPDLPPGHPLERFFREFRDQQGPRGDRPGPRQGRQSQGSGFFISGDGYLVTNNHVVDNATEVQVLMDDGRTLDAKVVGPMQRRTSRSSK